MGTGIQQHIKLLYKFITTMQYTMSNKGYKVDFNIVLKKIQNLI